MTFDAIHAAIVLAGGQSSRMGQDKALLNLGGETLIAHTCRIAVDCGHQVYVVTPFAESYRDHLPESAKIVLETPLPGQTELHHGPLVGLMQGLNALTSLSLVAPWVLVLACDLPNLSSAVLQQWQSVVQTQPEDILTCLPQRQGRWEPLCGFYRLTSLSSIKHYIHQGGRSFQGWLRQQSVKPLPLSDDRMLMNLNTRDDWQQWQGQS
jgi:molybdopterin-guanine dinucleotide biosynthesis protein A